MTAETTTDAEAKAIRTLKRLAKNWPSTLWLFASGDLHVMRTGKDGERVMVTQERALEGGHMAGGVDADYIVDSIDIPNDGGDW